MNPMMLHMLLLRAFSKCDTQCIVSRLKNGHDKLQLRHESCLRLNDMRYPLPRQTGIGSEERLPQSISHKKPNDRASEPNRRLAPNSKGHALAFRHRVDVAPRGIVEYDLFNAGLTVAKPPRAPVTMHKGNPFHVIRSTTQSLSIVGRNHRMRIVQITITDRLRLADRGDSPMLQPQSLAA